MIPKSNTPSNKDPPSTLGEDVSSEVMSTAPSPPPDTEIGLTPIDFFAHEDRDTDPGHVPAFHSTPPPPQEA